MKWYLNDKLISLLQHYAQNFATHSQMRELNRLAINIEPLPIGDLVVDKMEHESFWQKIINFFMGAHRVEMEQLGNRLEAGKWEISELEDELIRTLNAGLERKRKKLAKVRSGKKTSGDAQLFVLMLIEYVLIESIKKAQSERSRIEIYGRLINFIKLSIGDFSRRYFNGWLMELLEDCIVRLDEMLEYEKSQKELRAFQDSVSEIQLGTVVRSLNESIVGTLLPKGGERNLYYEASRISLGRMTFPIFKESEARNALPKDLKKLLSDETYFTIVRDGWMSNARSKKIFQSKLDERHLAKLAQANVDRRVILTALERQTTSHVGAKDLESVAKCYENLFKDLNQLYILSGLLTLIKRQSDSFGQSAAILYQGEVGRWFDITESVLARVSEDLKDLALKNRLLLPFLKHHNGNELFLTSDIESNLDKIRGQILTAKHYMRIDERRMAKGHSQFLTLMATGLDCIDAKNKTLRLVANQANPEIHQEKNRYTMFSANKPKAIQQPVQEESLDEIERQIQRLL